MQHILVATDFSPIADAALERAIAIAARTGARLTLIHAEPEYTATPAMGDVEAAAILEWQGLSGELRASDEAALRSRCERALAAGVKVADFATSVGNVDDVLEDAATSLQPDLMVVGTHGRTGIARFLMGSTAEHVVRRAPCSVLVSRGSNASNPEARRVLVGVDFSPASDKAVRQAIEMSAPNADIELVHVWQYPPGVWGLDHVAGAAALESLKSALTEGAIQRGTKLVAQLQGGSRRVHFELLHGPTASALTARAETGRFDLIAMGSHGYRGFRRFLLGSVAEATVRHAPCSVLVAHAEHPEK